MAFVDDTQWGIGVYSPSATKFLAGMSGSIGGEATSASTSYISPVRQERLMKNSVMEYEYYLVIGSLSEIRSKIYQIKSTTNLLVSTVDEALKLFPNPVKDKLFVETGSSTDAQIFNSNGMLLQTFKMSASNNCIDVSQLSSGMYLICFSDNNQNYSSRFVKL